MAIVPCVGGSDSQEFKPCSPISISVPSFIAYEADVISWFKRRRKTRSRAGRRILGGRVSPGVAHAPSKIASHGHLAD